jgi:oxalate decarboxylase/phosphoglucose isomerase-like protein (cupin superfamily)
MLNLGPCSMLPPHLHPRGANYVVAISGTTQTYMINENGARTVQTTLRSGQMTIFPTGSIHTMMNIGCENAQLISALNSDDSGTLNVANAFFSLPQNISGTVLGGDVNVQNVYGQIPEPGTGANFGPEQCIAACAARGKMVRRAF